jgi:asparagine synthase (glutamine-hydrolysing)
VCGIVGAVGPLAAAHDDASFRAAVDALAHRGPDGADASFDGTARLGHRRLAVIDLSDAGRQPMADPATGVSIVFNGEIYNYVELRRELQAEGEAFRTATDTEVLLRLWLRHGEDGLRRLNGMFAFAVWDPRSRELALVRDRFGVKPLAWGWSDGSLVFASEPKAALALLPGDAEADPATLYDFLALGRLYAADRTFYRGLRMLPPAHLLRFRPGDAEPRPRRWWDYPADPAPPGRPEEEAEAFAALLDDAVRIRLRSDVPVGLTLSGGLDSTACLAGAVRAGADAPVCFTATYGPGNRGEAGWAAIAGRPYGVEPVEVDARVEDWHAAMETIAWHLDGPSYSPAVFPVWRIAAEARRRGVPVLLEGQGADEALAGYPQYAALHALSSAARPGEALRTLRGAARTFTPAWTALWLAREAMPFLVGLRRRREGAAGALSPAFAALARSAGAAAPLPHDPPMRAADAVTRRLWADHHRDILPGLLHYGDAMSMSHGIEARQPFLDVRLVEWLFARPARVKIAEGRTKWVLRRYLEAAGQGAIAARSDKQGFPTPVAAWFRADGGRLLRDLLLSPGSRVRAVCEPAGVERLLGLLLAGRRGADNHLFRLATTEFWLRRCGVSVR